MTSSNRHCAEFLFFGLWIVSITIWFISLFWLWLLMDFQFVMWALEASEWLSRIILWLRPLIWLIIALVPPGLCFYLYQKHTAFWVIPILLVIGVALLKVSFDFGRIDTQGTIYKSLPQAIGQGDIKRARALVLTVANRYSFSKDVQALMKAGIDVNARDDRGQTLLISVVMWGENKQIDPDLVKTLIKAGVDVNAKDNYGKNALFYAARASNAAVIKALLQPDTDGDLKTNESTNQ